MLYRQLNYLDLKINKMNNNKVFLRQLHVYVKSKHLRSVQEQLNSFRGSNVTNTI